METKVFNTYVQTPMLKDDYVDCVVGNVTRVLAGVCGKPENVIHKFSNEHGVLLTTRCNQSDYDRFVAAINEVYPGLCEFDFKAS